MTTPTAPRGYKQVDPDRLETIAHTSAGTITLPPPHVDGWAKLDLGRGGKFCALLAAVTANA